MKTVLLASGFAMALMQSATAESRDSDGDVLSAMPELVYFRDSDGDVISVNNHTYYYRDSDGNVISVIAIRDWDYAYSEEVFTLEVQDGEVIQVTAEVSSDGTATLPQQVSIDGLIYKLIMSEDALTLQTASRVNPVAFSLD